mmetsp:Transcript_15736/g.22212  ORF Transcript_15736/g.22212 Transcript_15736/m.22212 type:complete len:220 (-) Transcript_15736:212-871(-)
MHACIRATTAFAVTSPQTNKSVPQPVLSYAAQPTQQLHTNTPNPQSQSFSRSYGSILPTSLIYILLSTRGFTPWRPVAVISTARGVYTSKTLTFGFSWIIKNAPDDTQQSAALPRTYSLSPTKLIPGNTTQHNVKKKRELFPGFLLMSPNCYKCYHILHTLPLFRNLNLIPFRSSAYFFKRKKTNHIRTHLSYLLGPTHSCPIAVHMKPFSTSVFKVLF